MIHISPFFFLGGDGWLNHQPNGITKDWENFDWDDDESDDDDSDEALPISSNEIQCCHSHDWVVIPHILNISELAVMISSDSYGSPWLKLQSKHVRSFFTKIMCCLLLISEDCSFEATSSSDKSPMLPFFAGYQGLAPLP